VLSIALSDFAMHAPSMWKSWRRFMKRRQLDVEHQESRRRWHASHVENRADRRRRAREKAKPRTAWADFVAIVLRVLRYIGTCCVKYLTGRVCLAILFILARYCWLKEQWQASLVIVLVLSWDDLLLPVFLDCCPTVRKWIQYSLYHCAWILYPYRGYLQSMYELVQTHWQSVHAFVRVYHWWALCCYLRFWLHADYSTPVIVCVTLLLLDSTRQPFSDKFLISFINSPQASLSSLHPTPHPPHPTPHQLLSLITPHQSRHQFESTSILPCIPTTVGVIITKRSNTTIRLLFDLSRPAAEFLRELGYSPMDVAVLCSHDRSDQYPRRRYTDTLLEYGLMVGIDNIVTIVRITSRQRLLGGPQHSSVYLTSSLTNPDCRYAVR
jgi:hypothetical protein